MVFFNPQGLFSLSAVLVTLTSRQMLFCFGPAAPFHPHKGPGISGLSQFSFSSGVFCFASCLTRYRKTLTERNPGPKHRANKMAGKGSKSPSALFF